MKHIIIGTAGHVDHGKTCLTRALTGVNTDRWAEEQERGITLDIGFAKIKLPGGQTASIIDVPGHKRLIKNMLAGATGFDVVLLVVDVCEGFMPQTVEHLEILDLLGVRSGIIVLTKRDLVDEEWLEVVEADCRERVEGSFLEDAPMIAVSAQTGEGIDDLRGLIEQVVSGAQEKNVDRPSRLPIDRVFTVKGSGTVVTGTLTDGMMQTGERIMIYPQERLTKVRELQSHDQRQEVVEAGMRVAVNLLGVERPEVSRGCTLAEPESMILSSRVTVWLRLTRDAPFNVRNSSRLHFYHGSQELICKVRLLDRGVLMAGESCFAQMAFEGTALAARNQDRFIVRFFSPLATVGGGVIVDMADRRLRRNDADVLDRLQRLNGTFEERVLQRLADASGLPLGEEQLLHTSGLSVAELDPVLDALVESGMLLKTADGYMRAEDAGRQVETILELVAEYQRNHNLARGMRIPELRGKVFPEAGKTADELLRVMVRKGLVCVRDGYISLPGFVPTYTGEQQAVHDRLARMYEDAGYEGLANADVQRTIDEDKGLYSPVLAHMLSSGELVALSASYTVGSRAYNEALQTFLAMFDDKEEVTLGEFRTQLGVSRKYAQLYLDYFDSRHLSKLVGGTRVLLPPRS